MPVMFYQKWLTQPTRNLKIHKKIIISWHYCPVNYEITFDELSTRGGLVLRKRSE